MFGQDSRNYGPLVIPHVHDVPEMLLLVLVIVILAHAPAAPGFGGFPLAARLPAFFHKYAIRGRNI